MSASAAPPGLPTPFGGGDLPPLGPEPRRRGFVLRMLLGCAIVVLASAATATVLVLGQVHTLVRALSENHSVQVAPHELAHAGFGGPQTLLLVGNDQRNHTTTAPVLPHSNEMLLVRIDPSKPWISMMSIPRELLTSIQCPTGTVATRFNYSLTCGGFSTLVSTIKQVTGLSVNHVVMIDFNNFETAVNEMGCVYSTVDRRYYHINTPTSQQYQEINLQPGYQKMCGTQALEFVSYRHGDTSLVRDARNQSFLLSVKQQYGPTLVDNMGRFEQIFGRLVTTDQSLHSTTGVLDLLGTLTSVADEPVRQVQFQVNLDPTNPLAIACACVTATPGQIATSVHSFLDGGAPLRHTAEHAALLARAAASAQGTGAGHGHRQPAALPLAPVPPAELAQARSAAPRLQFPLEYPRVQDAGGTGMPVDLRTYHIHIPGGGAAAAFVEVFSNGLLGQYYDVQGMTWTTPPLLDSPEASVRADGRTFSLFYTGQHLQLVAWYGHHAVYWVHNTLLDSISNGELLAIAEQTTAIGQPTGTEPGTGASRGAPRLTDVTAPVGRAGAAAGSGLAGDVGTLGGLITLVAAPLLGIALIVRRRQHARLRARLGATAARLGELRVALAVPGGTGMTPVTPPPSAMTIYRDRRVVSRRWLLGSLAAVTVAVAAGLGAVLVTGAPARDHPVARRQPPAPLPNVSVAVLNATEAQGAAARLASQLRARRITIARIGNVVDSQPGGLAVLYVPGARRQAARLAQLLPTRASTIAPIDPVVQAAAGASTRLAVIIT